MRVALLSYNARAGDAIGQSVADKLAFFLNHQAEVAVFLEDGRQIHPAVQPHTRVASLSADHPAVLEYLSTADLVIAEYGHYYNLLALLPAIPPGRGRVLIDYHGVTPPALWHAADRAMLERGVRRRPLVWRADGVLVHSQFTLRELRDELGYPRDRLHQLGFPIDLQNHAAGATVRNWRQELSLEGKKLLLFVGRLAPNKRVPTLIECVALLQERKPEVHAVIVGNAGESYQAEAEACRALAEKLGVAGRVHFLGPQQGPALRELYRCADALVHPSRWETFCLPIVEAMACGLPVVAARSTALPETVGDAGLTFEPDDATDLARQVERIFDAKPAAPARGKVAVVAFRFGTDFVGGAETSLRTLARTLQANGTAVEVFTTCVRSESDWQNELPAGKCEIDGLPVHRYPIDAHDRPRHLETVRRILDANGMVSEAAANEYLQHSIHSTALIRALGQRIGDFDAFITGPYLFGLTVDVARTFPDKTVLAPCFHDEPFARLPIWARVCGDVAGLLWHSPEEQHYAEVDLGVNHPRGRQLGALVDLTVQGNASAAGIGERYLLYCGRYTQEKELPRLLDHLGRYQERFPGRFRLVCIGQGPIALPRVTWLTDLGFVPESHKRDLLAGADALVQLSRYESLSLVVLEAFAQGTPAVVNALCPPAAAHVSASGGGATGGDYADFEATLNDLWNDPAGWQQRGKQGRDYVATRFGSAAAYGERISRAIADVAKPLRERMIQRGLARASRFGREQWRERFGAIVESVLEGEPMRFLPQPEVLARSESAVVATGATTVLVPVRMRNRGSGVLWPEGSARWTLHARIVGMADKDTTTPLPGPLPPGGELSGVAVVPAPDLPGEYQAEIWLEGDNAASPPARVRVVVGAASQASAPLLAEARSALAEAHRLHQLPDDYHDVTQGALAGVKRRVKAKLLGNFKHAYVDVLSRQQSACNAQLVRAVAELAECCDTLSHAMQLLNERTDQLERQLRRERRRRRNAAPEQIEDTRKNV